MTPAQAAERLETAKAAELAAPQRALVHALEQLGWQLTSAEIDLTRGHARIELRRADLLVTLDAGARGATVTREHIARTSVAVGRRGDRARVERLSTSLVGRTRHEGARSALRWLSNYIEDNSTTCERFAARRAFGLFFVASVSL